MLNAQFAGVVASPLTGLVRGLGALVSGLAVALGQVREQKESEAPPAPEPVAEERRRQKRRRRNPRSRSRPPRRVQSDRRTAQAEETDAEKEAQ